MRTTVFLPLTALLAAALPAQSLIRDINRNPSALDSQPGAFASTGDRLFFAAQDGTAVGRELWTWHPSTGAVLAGDLNPSGHSDPTRITAVGDVVLLFARAASGRQELFVSDGTPTGTGPAALPSGAIVNPGGGLLSDGRIAAFLVSTNGTWEPWVYHRATRNFAAIHSFGAQGGFAEKILVVEDGEVWLCARTATSGPALWRWDGRTMQLLGPAGGTISEAARIDGKLYFAGYDAQHGVEPWVGDAQGTRRLADLEPGAGSSSPRRFVGFGGDAYFMAVTSAQGGELYRYRPTASTVGLVADLNPGSGSGYSGFAPAVPGANHLLFIGNAGGPDQLYRTDGTAAGTSPVTRFGSGLALLNESLTSVCGDGRVLFRADDGTNGRELWVSDGTVAGTRMLFDLEPGAGSGGSGPARGAQEQPTLVGNQVFFAGYQRAVGGELFAFPAAMAELACGVVLRPGCGGSNGVPAAGSKGQPRLGSAGFALTVSGGRPNSGAFLLVDLQGGRIPLGGGCALFTGPQPFTLPHSTDAVGAASWPIPLPNDTNLLGLPVRTQWAVADPSGPYQGVLSISNGFALVIGR